MADHHDRAREQARPADPSARNLTAAVVGGIRLGTGSAIAAITTAFCPAPRPIRPTGPRYQPRSTR